MVAMKLYDSTINVQSEIWKYMLKINKRQKGFINNGT